MESLLHFLFPRPSNNHRPRALHTSSLAAYITVLLVVQIFITAVGHFHPQVLGYASNINVNDLFNDTNARRISFGVSPLNIDPELSQAATEKGKDMFANQYWAHVSPSGKDPWSWVISSGYNYIFAGENLARDFGDSRAVVDAWMNSPSHKENLLNSRFKDVGFAVINGKFGGSETTLVVQEFGARASQPATVDAPMVQPLPAPAGSIESTKSAKAATSSLTPSKPQPPGSKTGSILSVEEKQTGFGKGFRFDAVSLTENLSTGLLVALIAILAVDSYFVYKQKIVRLSGHNYAHIMFLIAVLVVFNLIGRGVIL